MGERAFKVNTQKLLQRILRSPHNIGFSDLTLLAEAFGFELSRINGSHHIYSHPDVPKLLNLQNQKGKAEPYQVRQFLKLVDEYNLPLEE